MKVQRIKTKDNRIRYVLLDDNYNIIIPVKNFLKHLDQLNRSIYTLRTYAYNLKIYYEFLSINKLTYTSILEKGYRLTILTNFIGYLKNYKEDNVVYLKPIHSSRSINLILNTVLSFYRFLVLNGDLPEIVDFTQKSIVKYKNFLYEMHRYKYNKKSYFKLKEQPRLINTISRDQLRYILNNCNYLRDKLLISLMFESGIRIGEALNMYIDDFLVWENRIRIKQHEEYYSLNKVKNHNEDILDIPPYVMKLFCRYISYEYPKSEVNNVFVNLSGKNKGHALKIDTVEKKFKWLSKKCGFKINPHMLRHSHATELIEVGGWDILDVKNRLRHKHIQTTIDTYINVSDDYKKRKFMEFIKKLKENGNDS